MAENTKIEWCHHTANLWHGCTEVHAGCDHCYAKTLSHRWGKELWGKDSPRQLVKSVWNDLTRYQRLAAEAGEMHRVFVGSMMDIFEKAMQLVDSKGDVLFPTTTNAISGEVIRVWMGTDFLRHRLFTEIGGGFYPDLMFLLLTKRHTNIRRMVPKEWLAKAPRNVMFGASAVDQKSYDAVAKELDALKEEFGFRTFISMEPQIGAIDLNPEWAVDWVIQGGESGHHARPMHPDWARTVRDQCKEAGIPYLFKQWGEHCAPDQYGYGVGQPSIESTYRHLFADGTEVYRVGKKAAGRMLDGRTHDEFPRSTPQRRDFVSLNNQPTTI